MQCAALQGRLSTTSVFHIGQRQRRPKRDSVLQFGCFSKVSTSKQSNQIEAIGYGIASIWTSHSKTYKNTAFLSGLLKNYDNFYLYTVNLGWPPRGRMLSKLFCMHMYVYIYIYSLAILDSSNSNLCCFELCGQPQSAGDRSQTGVMGWKKGVGVGRETCFWGNSWYFTGKMPLQYQLPFK